MALKLTVTTPCGFVATDAYHRVEGIQLVDKAVSPSGSSWFPEPSPSDTNPAGSSSGAIQDSNRTIVFSLSSKKDQEAQEFSNKQYYAPYDLTGENPIKQGYIYLKSLPEFSTAQDC